MKIIVNNDSEKKLLRRFLDAMHDLDGIEALTKMDGEYDDKPCLEGDDELFLRQAIYEATVVVDDTVPQICVEHWNLQGACVVCGGATDGTIDGDDISYDEWLDYTSESGRKSWKCEGCYGKAEEG